MPPRPVEGPGPRTACRRVRRRIGRHLARHISARRFYAFARSLVLRAPDQPSFQLGLFTPESPALDEATAETLRAMVAKGAMPPLVLVVDDCRAAYDRRVARGVELTQEPTERYGSVDAGFRDPSGNGWKMIQARA